MKAYPIADSVYALHADIDSADLFEGIWPIPHGVSLNSYVVKGDKVALIDLVRDWCDAPKVLEEELATIGVKPTDVDYLVLNHLEPDHTGWLAEYRKINPKVQILSTAKGIELVKSFYKQSDGLRAVASGDTLDLGRGKVLTFVETPNVHWPETMVTWDASSGTVFSCDAFGSFGKLGDRVFDDQFDAKELEFFERETLRYYANIVASFGVFVKRAIQKLEGLDVKVVAPSHGIIWRKDPGRIVDLYKTYAGYADGPRRKKICVIWGSMYGNTKRALDEVLRGVEAEGVPYTLHRVPNEDVSFILSDAYESEGILIAMPTYEYRMFPPMAYALTILERKHVKGRKALRIGSWGWVGGAKKEYDEFLVPLQWECVEPVEWAGSAGPDVMATLYERGRELARRVKG